MLKVLRTIVLSLLLAATTAQATQFGVGNEGSEMQQWKKLYDGGVRYVRLMVYWPKIERTPGIYDWSELDALVDAVTAAGITPYLNIMWVPKHASDDKPAYEEYLEGCTGWDVSAPVLFDISDGPQYDNGGKTRPGIARPDRYRVPKGGTINIPAPGVLGNDGGENLASVVKTVGQPTPSLHGTFTLQMDGSFVYTHDGSDSTSDRFQYFVWGFDNWKYTNAGGIHFEWEVYDYCKNPPAINSALFSQFVETVVERYKDRATYFGVWNEPEYGLYYPPRDWSKGEHAVDMERYLHEVLLPFVDAVRRTHPSAKIVGPETGSPDVMRWLLTREREMGARWYDVISWHGYSWGEGYPSVMLWRVDNWLKPSVEEFKGNRRVWISETGPDAAENTPEFFAEILAMAKELRFHPWIDVVIVHNYRAWFEADKTTPRDPFYFDFKKIAAPVRRRAVRHFGPEIDKRP